MKMNELAEVDTTENDQKATGALAYAKALVIRSLEDFTAADGYCKGLFNLRKAIEKDFSDSLKTAKEAKAAATAALSALTDQIASHVEPVQEAERAIKSKMFTYDQERKRLEQVQQDKLRAEALKNAEDEKIKKAEALQAQGKTAQAEAELDKPVKVAAIITPKVEVKTETKMSEYWSYTITTPSEVKRDFCKPDPGSIQASMNAYKKQGKTIAEVEERIGGIRIEALVK